MREVILSEDFDLDVMQTNLGRRIGDLSAQNPILLVFLRHFGCTFCREAIDELSKRKQDIEAKGLKIVFVHMAEADIAQSYFVEYHFPDAEHISDPFCIYYKEFGLVKGTMNQLFGLKNWAGVVNTGIIKGYGWGREIGDGFQMPGVFVIANRRIINSYIHKYVSDHPDYVRMAEECCHI
jgi:peroxiredoxin